MKEKKRCEKCGAILRRGASVCDDCGWTVTSTNSTDVQNSGPETATSKGKGKKLKGIIISILVVAIVSTVGEFAGKHMARSMMESDDKQKLDAFIEDMKEYTPGNSTEDGFVSEHFGFTFTANDQWYMYSEEELAPTASMFKEAGLASAKEYLRNENASPEIIDKWASTFYAEAEMGACFVADDIIAGETIIIVASAYGVDRTAEDDVVEGLLEEMSATAQNAVSGETIIAGERYKTVKVNVEVDGQKLVNEISIRMENGMYCMIINKALKGYEDAMKDSFLRQISAN